MIDKEIEELTDRILESEEFLLLHRKGKDWEFVYSYLEDINEAIDMMKEMTIRLEAKRNQVIRGQNKSGLN